MVANEIRLLIRVMTQSEIEFIDGPETPSERLEAAKKAAHRAARDERFGKLGIQIWR